MTKFRAPSLQALGRPQSTACTAWPKLKDRTNTLLTIEAHTITKMAALLDRPDSEKGMKDAGELLRLLKRGVDPSTACTILTSATAAPLDLIPDYVETAFRLIAEMSGANKAARRDLDRLRRKWVDAAQVAIDPNRSQRERPTLT